MRVVDLLDTKYNEQYEQIYGKIGRTTVKELRVLSHREIDGFVEYFFHRNRIMDELIQIRSKRFLQDEDGEGYYEYVFEKV